MADRGRIESSFERGLVVLAGTVNGRHPVRLILDTGADATVLTPQAVERIGLESGSMARVVRGSSGGGVETRRVPIDEIDFGGFAIRDFDALVLPLGPVEERFDGQIDGVVGWPSLRAVALQVDYPSQLVRVGTTAPPDAVVFPIVGRRAHIDAPLYGQTREYLVDTGYSGSLTLRASDVRPLDIEPLGREVVSGAYRAADEDLVRIDTPTEFAGFPIRSAQVYLSNGSRIIGNAWMRPFVVTFDQPGGSIAFHRTPTRPSDAPAGP